jgi:hypothetical protein
MASHDPRARQRRNGTVPEERNGAVLEPNPDGTTTLYALEHWNEVRTDSVIEVVESGAPGSTTGTLDGEPDERTDPTS